MPTSTICPRTHRVVARFARATRETTTTTTTATSSENRINSLTRRMIKLCTYRWIYFVVYVCLLVRPSALRLDCIWFWNCGVRGCSYPQPSFPGLGPTRRDASLRHHRASMIPSQYYAYPARLDFGVFIHMCRVCSSNGMAQCSRLLHDNVHDATTLAGTFAKWHGRAPLRTYDQSVLVEGRARESRWFI